MHESDEKVHHCSFCGKDSVDVDKLIAGPDNISICNECIDLCKNIMAQENGSDEAGSKEGFPDSIPTPKEIFDRLNKHVIGQEEAKKSLSIAVYNHYKRLKSLGGDSRIRKSNVLLAGPTGCGKTMLAEILAEIMDVPFAIADATTLTEAGYVGEDVENIITKLLQKCDYDVEKAQRGIIYIDEIDKISRRSENPSLTRDVGGEGVQQSLLKIIEGAEVSVPASGSKRKVPGESTIEVNTGNILFICGGAFAGIEKVLNEKKNANAGIGFGAKLKDISTDKDVNQAISDLEPDDLVKFGLIPEFIGRLPVVVGLHELDVDSLVRVLIEPEFSLVREYQDLFALESVDLHFEEDALRAIAQEAEKRKIGARGLRSIIEKTLKDTMFEAPSLSNLSSITVTKDVVVSGERPKYSYKKVA